MTAIAAFYDAYWLDRNGIREGARLANFVDLDVTELDVLSEGLDGYDAYNLAAVTLVADAGADQAAQASPITLHGSASVGATTYLWLEAGVEIAHGVSPTLTRSIATHTITLQVTDGTNVRTDTVVVQVTS